MQFNAMSTKQCYAMQYHTIRMPILRRTHFSLCLNLRLTFIALVQSYFAPSHLYPMTDFSLELASCLTSSCLDHLGLLYSLSVAWEWRIFSSSVLQWICVLLRHNQWLIPCPLGKRRYKNVSNRIDSIAARFHPSIHPPIRLSIRPPNPTVNPHSHPLIHPSIYPSIHLSIHPSISSIQPPIHHTSVHPSVHSSTHLFIHQTIHPFIRPSIYLSIRLFIYPSIRSEIHSVYFNYQWTVPHHWLTWSVTFVIYSGKRKHWTGKIDLQSAADNQVSAEAITALAGTPHAALRGLKRLAYHR